MTDAFEPGSMTWLLGIEDTCVMPPAGAAMASLDEHELTEHRTRWREDLTAVAGLGATALRYGVDWPLVHTAPGVFDWSGLDERLRFAALDLGLTVVADLVHYGTPTWLAGSFADPAYPDAVAEFAGAFAERYAGIVDHVTPLNEPVTTASFCGLRGVWPPARTGWDGWTAVVLGIVEGIRRTVAAVRAANPDAVVVHVEAAGIYEAAEPELEEHAALLRAVGDLPTDLLLGRVGHGHPMHGWLLEQGAEEAVLDGFRRAVPSIDLLGVNYYPDLSPRRLVPGPERVEQVAVNRWTTGLRDRLRHAAERYGVPLLVTETSIEGDDGARASWLADSARAVLGLREEGLDIRGYTWWPLLDFVDWSYASGGRNVEEFLLAPGEHGQAGSAASEVFGDVADGRAGFLRRMGLLHLEEDDAGGLAREPGGAAALYRTLATATATASARPRDRVG